MTRDARQTLGYGAPPSGVRRASLLEVGCGASAVGVVLFGCFLPCGGLYYALNFMDDLGGPAFWPILVVTGALAGAVLGPLVSVPLQLLLRHFARRRGASRGCGYVTSCSRTLGGDEPRHANARGQA